MTALRPYCINETELESGVVGALKAGANNMIIPATFHAVLVDGLLVSDARMRIRVEVTLAERASGLMRRESELAIALREARAAAQGAAMAAAVVIGKAAETQTRLYALVVEAQSRMNADAEGRRDRGFFRLRSALARIGDALRDHGRAGRRVDIGPVRDLLSIEAWAPVVPALDLDIFRREILSPGAAADAGLIDRVCAMAEALATESATTPVAWRDLAPADIAAVTADHRVRHLLTTASGLRDQAASLAGVDPARAGRLMSEVSEIEAQALDAATGRNVRATGDDLESGIRALRAQAGRAIGDRQ